MTLFKQLKNLAAGVSAMALSFGLLVTPTLADDDHVAAARGNTLKFDIAENASRFVFDDAPVFDDGFPAHGNSFITQGYIYPYGFLDGRDGVLPNGEPAYPQEVIGVWACRGWFIGDGAHAVTGPLVMTTQHYDFFTEPGYDAGKFSGARNLITEGYELADFNVPVTRAVTGGTGPYRAARGEAVQELLGFDDMMGVRLRVVIKVRR